MASIDQSTVRKLGRNRIRAALTQTPWSSSCKLFDGFVCVPQEEFDFLPLHFLPDDRSSLKDEPSTEEMLELCVGSKLAYAHNRWLDAIVDDTEESEEPNEIHHLNSLLTSEVLSTFNNALGDQAAGCLFSLAQLYSSYSLSSVFDVGPRTPVEQLLSLEDYASQAKARAAPMRAGLDGMLAKRGVDEPTASAAKEAFEDFMVAVQLYDDVLDVEEDLAEGRTSWLIAQVFTATGYAHPTTASPDNEIRPTEDEFYAAALIGGHLSNGLLESLNYLEKVRRTSEVLFPGWCRMQNKLSVKVRALLEEYSTLAASYNS